MKSPLNTFTTTMASAAGTLTAAEIGNRLSQRVQHRRLTVTLLSLLVLARAMPGQAATAGLQPSNVLVVYKVNGPDQNGNGVSDSLELAQYYAQKRGVPQMNLLGLTLSVGSYYGPGQYTTFYKEMVAPIRSALTSLGPTNIDVILLAGELPTVVYDGGGTAFSVDGALMGINTLGSAAYSLILKGSNPYFDFAPGFDASAGRFSHRYLYKNTNMYLVTHLGTDSSLRGIDQVDQSLYADLYVYPQGGYSGNAYVNSLYGQPNGSLYTDAFLSAQPAVKIGNYDNDGDADMNIAYAEHYVLSSGFPLKWQNTNASLSIGDPGATYSDGTSAATAPRALFYGGWYNYNKYNNVFGWLPGSFACDLNSGLFFGMQALDHGASAASYVVSEPFLDGAPRPDFLYYYMLKGYTFAEASALATPYLGWMNVSEGDPLYAPLQQKTLVIDNQAPVLSPGYPTLVVNPTTGSTVMNLMVNNSAAPEVVTAQVQYGPDTNYGSVVTSSGAGPLVEASGVFSKTPTVSLPWSLGAVYHYRIVLTDPVGNVTTTGDYTNTPAVSMTAPGDGLTIVGTVQVSANATDRGGVTSVQFTLDGSNLGAVVTGTGPSYSISWDTTKALNGTHTLAAIARNSAGNVTTSSSISVTVNNYVPPPVISAVTASGITTAGATITWTTDLASNSQVAYGTTASYGSLSALNSTMVTAHSVTLTGLTPSTLYHYQVLSQGAQGAVAKSADYTFTTAQTYSIWNSSAVPQVRSSTNVGAIAVGMRFQSSVAGTVTGIRFYKGPTNTGTHIGSLWTNTGTLLATVTFTNETATGWQQANLSSPVAISANTTYVVSYFAPNGGFAYTTSYFATSGVSNPPLTALVNSTSAPNGVYVAGSNAFPKLTYSSTNYWVDLVFAKN